MGRIEHDGGAGPHLSRRRVLGVLLGSAVAATVAAAIRDQSRGPSGGGPSSTVPNGGSAASGPASPKPMSVGAQSVPTSAVRAGRPEVIFNGDPAGGAFALTFDDGTCAACAAAIVEAVHRSGFHATFSPNGAMGPTVWDSQADAIAEMAARGQVSICNHTWDHHDMTKLSEAQVQHELLANEQWIQQRFGVTSRPFYRPPYGAHDPRVDEMIGELGFTKVIMWNGTFGDSIVHPPEFILAQLDEYLKPGTIMLSHANHPATASVIDQIITKIQASGLHPATLLELLGAEPNPNLAKPDRTEHINDGGAPRSTVTPTTNPSTSGQQTPHPTSKH